MYASVDASVNVSTVSFIVWLYLYVSFAFFNQLVSSPSVLFVALAAHKIPPTSSFFYLVYMNLWRRQTDVGTNVRSSKTNKQLSLVRRRRTVCGRRQMISFWILPTHFTPSLFLSLFLSLSFVPFISLSLSLTALLIIYIFDYCHFFLSVSHLQSFNLTIHLSFSPPFIAFVQCYKGTNSLSVCAHISRFEPISLCTYLCATFCMHLFLYLPTFYYFLYLPLCWFLYGSLSVPTFIPMYYFLYGSFLWASHCINLSIWFYLFFCSYFCVLSLLILHLSLYKFFLCLCSWSLKLKRSCSNFHMIGSSAPSSQLKSKHFFR